MARIRTIKPEFWGNEKLSLLPESTHMLAAALLNYADDEGYFNANPELVKAACFPLRTVRPTVAASLSMLRDIGYIVFGDGEDGRAYGRILRFTEHQSINKAKESKIAPLAITWHTGAVPDGYRVEQGTGNGTGNREQGGGELRKRATPQAKPIAPEDCKYPVFPTTPGTDTKANSWTLEDALVEELSATFPAVDVQFQARKAHGWVMANLRRRKTYDGMRKFLFSWMAREQDSAKVGPSKSNDPRGNKSAAASYLERRKGHYGES